MEMVILPEKEAEMTVQMASSPILLKYKTDGKSRKRNSNAPLSKEQVQAVMLAVDNTRDAVFLHLGFNVGWRVSEPLSFTQDSINWE
jgi:hypothetical protein